MPSSTLLDLSSKLAGEFPGLDPILAEDYVQTAWQYIRGKRNWSFLTTDYAFVCPAAIITGTVDFAQYASVCTLSATASAAVIAAGQVNPPSALAPGLDQLQIRFGPSSPAAGQIYSITSYDATNPTAIVLTLNRPIIETANATSPYQIYRCYVPPPFEDFQRWESVVDMVNAQPIALNMSSAYFDLRDPQRTSQGLAFMLGRYETTYVPDPVTGTVIPNSQVSAGTPLYELWPGPSQGQTFYCRVRRLGTDLTSIVDSPPATIMPDLVLTRARYKDVYPYLRVNLNNFPSFKGVPLTELYDRQVREFKDLFQTARRMDEDVAQQAVVSRGHGLRDSGRQYFKGDGPFPIDANFIQSHLIRN